MGKKSDTTCTAFVTVIVQRCTCDPDRPHGLIVARPGLNGSHQAVPEEWQPSVVASYQVPGNGTGYVQTLDIKIIQLYVRTCVLLSCKL